MSESPPPRRLNTDLIVSGAAIFVSLCTLIVLPYEARIMREQQRAAVWPYVEIGPGFKHRRLPHHHLQSGHRSGANPIHAGARG